MESSHQHLKFSFQKPECWITYSSKDSLSLSSHGQRFFSFFSFFLKFRNVANSTRPPATRAKGKLKKNLISRQKGRPIVMKLPDLDKIGYEHVARIQQDSEIFLLPYLTCSQAWLNPVVDDSKHANITKLDQKKKFKKRKKNSGHDVKLKLCVQRLIT